MGAWALLLLRIPHKGRIGAPIATGEVLVVAETRVRRKLRLCFDARDRLRPPVRVSEGLRPVRGCEFNVNNKSTKAKKEKKKTDTGNEK